MTDSHADPPAGQRPGPSAGSPAVVPPTGRAGSLASAELMSAAWRAVGAATHSATANGRYVEAHLAALRAAAAVLAVRSHRPGRRTGPPAVSAWTLLARLAPELREWSDFFTVSARVAGVLQDDPEGPDGPLRRVSERQADDLLRDAERFLVEVRALLMRDRRRGRSAGAR